jgi:hypothetical protein
LDLSGWAVQGSNLRPPACKERAGCRYVPPSVASGLASCVSPGGDPGPHCGLLRFAASETLPHFRRHLRPDRPDAMVKVGDLTSTIRGERVG